MDEERKVIYVCSKYRGDIVHNTMMAKGYCGAVINLGHIPIAPHLLLPQFMDEELERHLALSIDLGIMDRCCDEVWVFGNGISEGMAMEIEHAKETGKPIRYLRMEDASCTQSVKE